MIVMKFGGSSVESAAAIERVAGIVKAREERRPVVVVSAMGKTTNKLLAIAAHDLGTNITEPVDYPDTAAAVARQVARGEADAGIAIDGAGLGSTIAANKVAGVRAAMCLNSMLARYARQHNGANVLALGATLVSKDEALAIVDTFLGTPMREARYIRRLAKIKALEQRPRMS